MDYTVITGAVSFADLLVGIGALSVLMAAVNVAVLGARWLLQFVDPHMWFSWDDDGNRYWSPPWRDYEDDRVYDD